MRVAKDFNGTIRTYSKVPEKWEQDFAFYMRNKEEWNAKGFYEVVDVTPSETQKIGAIYFDAAKEVFTYPLIDLTQEELDQKAENELNQDAAQQAQDTRQSDGNDLGRRIFGLIERKYRAGDITAGQAKAAQEILYPLVEPLYKGLWVLTQTRLNGAIIPLALQPVYNWIKGKVDSYVTNNY